MLVVNPSASLIGLAFKPALGEGYAFLNDWTLILLSV
ncbi:MAG: hypothetical protein RLZZ407_2023 [Pseudomonadota bacterium]|jgi:hypothetical protein